MEQVPSGDIDYFDYSSLSPQQYADNQIRVLSVLSEARVNPDCQFLGPLLNSSQSTAFYANLSSIESPHLVFQNSRFQTSYQQCNSEQRAVLDHFVNLQETKAL